MNSPVARVKSEARYSAFVARQIGHCEISRGVPQYDNSVLCVPRLAGRREDPTI